MCNVSKKNRRFEKIVELIDENGYVTLKDLANKLSVSEMTLRRDYEDLKDEYKVVMINGVFLKNSLEQKDEIALEDTSEDEHIKEKIRLGKFSASLINDYDTVAFDIGTTTEQIANYIPNYDEANYICYTYNIFEALVRNKAKNIFLSGGMFVEEKASFVSNETTSYLNSFRINKAFISAAGVSLSLGITCTRNYEVPIKKAIMASSLEKILVFDSSKYNSVKSSYFGEITEFTEVVTDENIDTEFVEFCSSKNIKVNIIPSNYFS